jgi:hypothetical protein
MAVGELGFNALIIIYVALAAGMANICLLLGLLYAYWKTYKEVKSEFTIGLLFFASFLLLQNIFSAIFLTLPLIIPIEFNGPELGGPRLPLIIINLIQLVALSILFKITRK